MKLSISIFGLIIIAVIYIAAWGMLLAIWRKVRDRRWGRVVVFVAAIAVLIAPWADEVWIAWNFHEFCKGSGVHVSRKVVVDGYFDGTFHGMSRPGSAESPQSIEALDKMGFGYVELRTIDGQVVRIEKSEGLWRSKIVASPTARYHYKRIVNFRDERGIHHEAPVSLKIEVTGEEIVDTKTGEKLGERVIYKRRPGWVDGLWIGYFGSGLTLCPDPGRGPKMPSLRESVLLPIL